MNIISIADAFEEWESLVDGAIDPDDTVALSESWNNYTDSLCKDGLLTDLQYEYAPAFDEDMPEDDFIYICKCLGIPAGKAQQLQDMALSF